MRCLSIGMKGMFYAEMVTELPDFKSTYEGRIVYCANDQTLYFGTKLNWKAVVITQNSINTSNICWDWTFQLQSPLCVNSKVIPTQYSGEIQSLQTTLDQINESIVKIQDGSYFVDGFIKRRHIDTVSNYGFTAEYLPIANKDNCFGLTTSTSPIMVEDALTILCNRRANQMKLSRNKTFGTCIKSVADNVETALNDLEQFICNLTASSIECHFFPLDSLGPCCDYNVQQALDMINWKFLNLKVVDLTDLYGRNYGECRQVLHTCGQFPDNSCSGPCGQSDDTAHIFWDYINANEVTCSVPCYPDIDNVQQALNIIMCPTFDCAPTINTLTDALYEVMCNGRGYMYYKIFRTTITGPTTQSIDCTAWWIHAHTKFPTITEDDFYCWAIIVYEDLPVQNNGPYSQASASLGDYAFIRYKSKFESYDSVNKCVNLSYGPTSDQGTGWDGSRVFPGGNEITYSTHTFCSLCVHIYGAIKNKNFFIG